MTSRTAKHPSFAHVLLGIPNLGSGWGVRFPPPHGRPGQGGCPRCLPATEPRLCVVSPRHHHHRSPTRVAATRVAHPPGEGAAGRRGARTHLPARGKPSSRPAAPSRRLPPPLSPAAAAGVPPAPPPPPPPPPSPGAPTARPPPRRGGSGG